LALNLIHNHEALTIPEGQHGLGQPGHISRIFQIEEVGGASSLRHELVSQGRFAYLAGPNNGHNWVTAQQILNAANMMDA